MRRATPAGAVAGSRTGRALLAASFCRQMSDVYLKLNSGEDIFLNNVLLENGHAVRKDSYELEDWNAEVR